MFETSSPINMDMSSTVSSISIHLSQSAFDESRLSQSAAYLVWKRIMSTVQRSSDRLKELLYKFRTSKCIDYEDLRAVFAQLLETSFSEDGRRIQIASGVVANVIDLLVLDLSRVQTAPNQALDSNSRLLRHEIARLFINLTFKSPDCKNLLRTNEKFITCVAFLLSNCPSLVKDYSDLIRNITWECDKERCLSLFPTVRPLAIASVDVSHRMSRPIGALSESCLSNSSSASDEKILNSIYSALWNMALSSSRCRETMCQVENFLVYLVKWLDGDYSGKMVFVKSLVGLSKCLIEQIYQFPNSKLRENFIINLMNVVVSQVAQPDKDLTHNVIHALSICIKHKNDDITNQAFYKTHRFQFDLRQLSSKPGLDDQTQKRIQRLLEHVSFCEGLVKGRVQSPYATPTYYQSPSVTATPSYAPIPMPAFASTIRPNMPLTSLMNNPLPSNMRGTPAYRSHFHHNIPSSINTTPTSQDGSGLTSSVDSKMGYNSRKHEDMKSSGYSETSMGSENFPHHQTRYQHEPRKQAYIRNLPQTQNVQAFTSPTNSSDLSSMYENALVIAENSVENLQTNHNYYQNQDELQHPPNNRESFYLGIEDGQYGSQDSLYCNGRSQHQSMTSIATMSFCQSEGISPKSVNLSPINEDDIDESDSASQQGFFMEKYSSINTTPCTTMTNNSTICAKQKNPDVEVTPLKQNLLNLPKINPGLFENNSADFNQTY